MPTGMADSRPQPDTGVVSDHVAGFVAGLLGGCAGLVFGHPFDTVKFFGFYKGMCFPLASVGILNSIFFGVYNNVHRTIAQRRYGDPQANRAPVDIMAAAGIAGAVQAVPATCIELVKVKLQAQTNSRTESFKARYSGAIHCLRSIYHDHGIHGSFHGLGSTVMRDVPGFATYMVMYETLCDWLRAENDGRLGYVASLWAGGTAGVISWMVNIPIDVMKSRIQADDLDKPRYRGLADCAIQSYRADGAVVFWRGLSVTCVRAFPLNAVTLTVYSATLEALKGFNGHGQ